jgi:hypothetical protein
MQRGMIEYVIPLEQSPVTYNKQALQYAALTSQKNYLSLYLMNSYDNSETERWFVKGYGDSRKKLDVCKPCVHFKELDDFLLT